MIASKEPKLLDLVAVVKPHEGGDVLVGDVGTVVELLPPDAVEVEFLGRDGRTRCVATFKAEELLVHNRERSMMR